MGSEARSTNTGTVKQTALHSVDTQVSAADGIGMVKKRLSSLTWRFHKDLSNEVFDDGSKDEMEDCSICDLRSLLVKIY